MFEDEIAKIIEEQLRGGKEKKQIFEELASKGYAEEEIYSAWMAIPHEEESSDSQNKTTTTLLLVGFPIFILVLLFTILVFPEVVSKISQFLGIFAVLVLFLLAVYILKLRTRRSIWDQFDYYRNE